MNVQRKAMQWFFVKARQSKLRRFALARLGFRGGTRRAKAGVCARWGVVRELEFGFEENGGEVVVDVRVEKGYLLVLDQ